MRAAALITLLLVACAPIVPVDLGALGPGSAVLLLERDGDRTSLYGTELTAQGGLLFGAPVADRTWILAYDRPLLALGLRPGRIELEPAIEPPDPDARRVPVPVQVVRHGENQGVHLGEYLLQPGGSPGAGGNRRGGGGLLRAPDVYVNQPGELEPVRQRFHLRQISA